jgi:hypothetical protein
MTRFAALLILTAGFVFAADYKAEPGGAPPADLAPEFAAVLQAEGTRITEDGKPYAGIWFSKSIPEGKGAAEQGVTLQNIPLGALLGVVHFPEGAGDRRGQKMAPGLYSMRFQLHPVDGAHQGVALQRDFLVLSPMAAEKDPAAKPNYGQLVVMSRKASGTPHPAVLEIWKDEGATAGTLEKLGDHDWVLHSQIGDTPVAVIVAGVAEAH